MAHNWFIVHAYSNFEKQVANSIKEQATQRGMEDKFSEILVPTEDVVQVRKGRKVQSERKFFPGYVLVKMEMSDDCLLYTSPSPRDKRQSRMPSSA